MGYKPKLMTKEITYDNYEDISEDAPVILDGICEELLLAKKNIELLEEKHLLYSIQMNQ